MRVPGIGLRLQAEPVRFTFDGRHYTGYRGDTAASALLANGVRLLGRSVKYRRPRGLLAAGPEEPNALFTVGAMPSVIPNVPAPQLILRDGLILRSQNRWPSLRHDVGSVLEACAGFLGAGFYYKTFIWPSWRCYESLIRNLAGLGEAPRAASLGTPSVEQLSCDVLIGGGGPAGLAAALAAARCGARVVLCEREPMLGGELEFEGARIGGQSAVTWLGTVRAELAERGARLLTETVIVGGSGRLVIAHGESGGPAGRSAVYRIRPSRFVIAMGAIERPIAFIDNDRPGVMLLGAAERLLARYGVAAGERPLLFGNHDRLYAAAARLQGAGIRVRAVIDTRDETAIDQTRATQAVRQKLIHAGIECLAGHTLLGAEGGSVRGARIAALASTTSESRIDCDTILVSGGWTPAIQAGVSEAGVRRYAEPIAAFVADRQPDWRLTAGAASGLFELSQVIADGFAAGERAASAAGANGNAGAPPEAHGDAAPGLVPFWRSPATLEEEKRQFVDFQNDVTVADLRQALGEGFIDIEHLKRYTTLGVGTEQGRTSSDLAAAIVAELRGLRPADVGTSRTRAPYHPVTLASLAGWRVGENLRALRRSALHLWHQTHAGVLEPAEYWMRPRFYRTQGADAFSAGIAEAARVRAHGGILDASTLGKIELAGPDAARFLDQLYLTKASTVKMGRGKYMVNLREDGMVLDDGLILRLAADRYLATTGSTHAQHMLSHFEYYRDTQWSGAAVALTDVTEAWSVIVVAGPASRDTLRAVLGKLWRPEIDRLTYMDFSSGRWQDGELRVLRASFSGELAFELHCRPVIAVSLWQALVDAGLPPYGLEALDILRIEKGYPASSEMNGQTTPLDLGMDALVRANNACLGRPLLDRPAFHEPSRPRLVGLRATDGKATIRGGAQITTESAPSHSLGHITSSAFSPAVGEWIALALVARSHAVEGATLMARDPLRGQNVQVRVTALPHYDPKNERMKS